MVVCIDFNGVIENGEPPAGKKMGGLVKGAEEALEDLWQQGHHIIIHTTMANSPSGRKAVADWLEFFGIDYHEIVPKPAASWYIDDKAISFRDWESTLKRMGIED